jgi:hypothetical protein
MPAELLLRELEVQPTRDEGDEAKDAIRSDLYLLIARGGGECETDDFEISFDPDQVKP